MVKKCLFRPSRVETDELAGRRSHRFLPKVPWIRSNWTFAAEVDRTNAISSRQGSRTRSSPLIKATTIPISVFPLRTMTPPANSRAKTPTDCSPPTRNFNPNLSLNTRSRTPSDRLERSADLALERAGGSAATPHVVDDQELRNGDEQDDQPETRLGIGHVPQHAEQGPCLHYRGRNAISDKLSDRF